MAKPDLADGWFRIALELEAALDFADFSRPARTVLRFGFCQIFGRGHRPRLMHLPVSALAARIDWPRQHLWRGRDELIASGVIALVRDDFYRFNKDYESWVKVDRSGGKMTPRTERRLSSIEVADCKLAPAYARAYELPTVADESVINPDDEARPDSHPSVINPDDAASSIRMTDCHQSGLQTVIRIDDKTSPPPKNPPSRKIKKNRKEQLQQEEVLSLDDGPASIEDDGPAVTEEDSPEHSRLIAWVHGRLAAMDYDDRALADAERLCRRWLGVAGDPLWCAQAFQAAIDNPDVLDKTPYARGVLARMYHQQQAGEPVLAPAFCDFQAAAAAAPAPTTAAAPTLALPPPRPTKSQRDAAEFLRRREAMIAHQAAKEAARAEGQ